MKRCLSLLLVLALVIACAPVIPFQANAATVMSGSCGENLTWTLDTEGTLTISGTGTMPDYDTYSMPWVDRRVSIKSIIIESGVTGIGAYAFSDCTYLTNVSIPGSVTSIGNHAFAYCSSLTNVSYQGTQKQKANVTIGSNNDSLTNANWTCTGTEEEPDVEDDCVQYLTWEIVDGEANITGCDTAISGAIVLPSTLDGYPVTGIGESAFLGCSSLTSVEIPDGVTSIGDFAFLYCSSLTSITLPDTVTSIGTEAFYDCTSLTSITIPNTVTSIAKKAFSGCRSLTNVNIPESVTYIGNEVFRNCKSLNGIWVDEKNTNYSNDSYGVLFNKEKTILIAAPGGMMGDYTIPNSVTSISEWAFSSFKNLTSVVMPDSVTSIGDAAFTLCNSLTTVYYQGTEEQKANMTIGSYNESLVNANWVYETDEEENDEGLTWVIDGEGTLTISGTGAMPDYDYEYGDAPWVDYRDIIKCVIIESGITSIGNYAFDNCRSLTSIEIPDSVTSIGDYAFYNCRSLTSIEIPNSVTSIGDLVFNSCYSLTSIVIPGSITSISYCAFNSCTSLESVVIQDGVTSIGDEAFYYCTSLESIVIPDSVTSIDSFAFNGCSSLTGIWVDEENTKYSSDSFGVLFNKDKTTLIKVPQGIAGSYTIPASVTRIFSSAFDSCGSLTSIVIPDGVTSIGGWTFGGCSSLTSIEIPASVTSIGDCALHSCDSLTTVYYQGTEEQKANMTIGSYNDTLVNATWIYASSAVCEYLETGKETATKFETLDDALVAATNGTITLLTDVTGDTVVLKPGVTLDLNGYTLTANLLVAMNGAKVTDGGEDCVGGGCLKIAKGNLALAKDNGGIIPVWNGVDGYVFTKVTFQQMTKTAGEGAVQYIFLPTFSNAEAAVLMADGGLNNDLKVKVSLTWGNGQSQQFYTYNDELVKKVFDGTNQWVFDLRVNGIGGIADMTASAVVVADSGAQAAAADTALVTG